MLLRLCLILAGAFTLASAGLAIDCARMCLMGGSVMQMGCLFARLTGWACDTGMLIGLVLATWIGVGIVLMVWLAAQRAGATG